MLKRLLIFTFVLVAVFTAVAGAATPKRVTIRQVGYAGDLAVGFNSVWAPDHRGGVLYRINHATNRVKAIEVGESLCGLPAFGGGAVWIWGCDSNVTYEVDPSTNRVVAQRRGGNPAFGDGSLWTLSPAGAVLRIDPRSGLTLATITADTTNGGPALAAAGSMWIEADDAVTRIDLQTNKVKAVIPLPGWKGSGDVPGGFLYANYIVYANGKIWDSNAAGLYVIDPATDHARRIAVELHPFSQFGDAVVAAGRGSIWIRTGDASVARIDPHTGTVTKRYSADRAGGGGGIAVGFGSLWIANFGSLTVWREPVG